MSVYVNKFVLLGILTILFFTNGFSFVYFPGGSGGNILKILILACCGLSLLKRTSRFETKLLLLAFFLIASLLYSIIVNHQNPYHLIVGSTGYFGFFLFLFFKKKHIPFYAIDRALQVLMLLMIACYIFQWLVYPKVFFTAALDEESISDSVFRMRMACSALSYIAFFYGVNKLIVKRRKIYIVFSILGFIPMIVMGFRSLMFMSMLFFAIMLVSLLGKTKSMLKAIAVLTAFVVVGINTPLVQDKLNEMVERTENNQSFSNKKYARNLALQFYPNYAVSQGPLYLICGGGLPLFRSEMGYDMTNEYQKDMLWAENHRIFWVDIGLVGLACIIGIPAVILIIVLCLSCAYYCKSPELQFVRFSLLTLLFGTGITSMELYRSGNFFCIGLLFYYVYIYNK